MMEMATLTTYVSLYICYFARFATKLMKSVSDEANNNYSIYLY